MNSFIVELTFAEANHASQLIDAEVENDNDLLKLLDIQLVSHTETTGVYEFTTPSVEDSIFLRMLISS